MAVSLYELSADLQTVIDGGLVFDEETGEVVWDSESLDALQCAYADKVEACGIVIKNLHAEAEAMEAEEIRLCQRRKRVIKKEERLREYVASCLDVVGGKLSTPRVSIATRRSEAVEVSEDAQIPEQYTVAKTTVRPDKALLRKAVKSGEVIPGVELVERESLVIR